MARTQTGPSSMADLFRVYIEKLSQPVRENPFRALGYAFAAGALLATRPGRILVLGLLRG